MPVYVNDNGTLRQIQRAFVNDNGTLREITEIAVNDNGTLREVFLTQVELAASYDYSQAVDNPTDASAGFRLASTGDILGAETSNISPSFLIDEGDWLVSGAASDYEVRATLDSGALTSGTTGSWLALSTTRTWYCAQGGIGTKTADLTIEIRRASDSVVIATATVSLRAEVDAGG